MRRSPTWRASGSRRPVSWTGSSAWVRVAAERRVVVVGWTDPGLRDGRSAAGRRDKMRVTVVVVAEREGRVGWYVGPVASRSFGAMRWVE
jgi:hypothetical protein